MREWAKLKFRPDHRGARAGVGSRTGRADCVGCRCPAGRCRPAVPGRRRERGPRRRRDGRGTREGTRRPVPGAGARGTRAGVPGAPLRRRSGEAYEEKGAVAQWAARHVELGETLLLDPGTTVGAPAHEPRAVKELTIATTGLSALHALADAEGVHVECLGGTLRPLSRGYVGPLTEAEAPRGAPGGE
ncbi:hypothetical protein [Streptomyces sp. NPDC058457]|uniref:hypothetical protein n=1 Tax=Streptomyces sp. NPDC058457 TaxID=3346507 RepID=UPI0036543D7D